MMRLAIVISHPIQYYAPVFKLLNQAENLAVKVFYTMGEMTGGRYDHGFKKNISWDIPLLEGYDFEWVKNTAKEPGSHHRTGVVNPGLIDQLNKWQPDVILVYGWYYQSHLAVMRHFKNNIPVLFRGDSTLLDAKKKTASFLRNVFLRWVYRHIDHAFYVGTNNLEYFKKAGVKSSQLTFSPHAVDNERFFANKSNEAASLRAALNIAEHHILILFAGKFQRKKSPLLLLEVFLDLAAPAAHLLFVGNGDLEDELKRKAKGADRVHFLPFQNQSKMPEIYQASDIFCLPSAGPGETWGLAINEAMASGIATLVSDKVGCAIDLVKPGNTGEIFKADDKADLRSKMAYLTEDRRLLKILGSNAKDKIAYWNFDRQVAAIVNTIETYGSQ